MEPRLGVLVEPGGTGRALGLLAAARGGGDDARVLGAAALVRLVVDGADDCGE